MTLKYRPDFPDRFGSLEHGRSFCGDFFPWYNTEHHHVGLGLYTPHDVHYGLAEVKREQRARVLEQAYALHPERFTRGMPKPKAVPSAVWINAPKPCIGGDGAANTTTTEVGPERSRGCVVILGGRSRSRPAREHGSQHRAVVQDRGSVNSRSGCLKVVDRFRHTTSLN